VPRVVLDDVVVQRRTWHLPVAEFQDLSGRNRESALLARLRDQGVPRHVFVQVPGDSKPVFCDLHSPPLAGNILRLVNRAAHTPGDVVRVQEMFPGFDQLWLTGDSGDRRTSEFRFVATDRRGAGVPA
jgi:hypothetical protein